MLRATPGTSPRAVGGLSFCTSPRAAGRGRLASAASKAGEGLEHVTRLPLTRLAASLLATLSPLCGERVTEHVARSSRPLLRILLLHRLEERRGLDAPLLLELDQLAVTVPFLERR